MQQMNGVVPDMVRTRRQSLECAVCFALFSVLAAMPTPVETQSGGPTSGTLVLTGGGEVVPLIRDAFLEAAGGDGASISFILIRRDPEDARSPSEFERLLERRFRADVTLLHSNDRDDWNSDAFVETIKNSTGVWISGGSQGRLANLMLDTQSHAELEALLERGGVLGGQSGGAMIAASFMLRGHPDKPALIAREHTRGFGFLRNVVINPYLTARQRENQLVTAVDLYPELLGVGIDDAPAIVVERDAFKVVGRGRVAIYDNRRHGEQWYYYLDPDAVFDLLTRTVSHQRH